MRNEELGMRPCEHRGKPSEWEWMGTMRIMRMDDGEIQKAAEPWGSAA